MKGRNHEHRDYCMCTVASYNNNHDLIVERLVRAVTLLTFIRKVPGSNTDPGPFNPEVSRTLTQSHEPNSEIWPQVTTFAFHYSTLPFDAKQYKPLIAPFLITNKLNSVLYV